MTTTEPESSLSNYNWTLAKPGSDLLTESEKPPRHQQKFIDTSYFSLAEPGSQLLVIKPVVKSLAVDTSHLELATLD